MSVGVEFEVFVQEVNHRCIDFVGLRGICVSQTHHSYYGTHMVPSCCYLVKLLDSIARVGVNFFVLHSSSVENFTAEIHCTFTYFRKDNRKYSERYIL